MINKKINRRDFLKTTATVASATIVSKSLLKRSKSLADESIANYITIPATRIPVVKEVVVVVIGAGPSGFSAALLAARN
jgi:threonine dehydrogenase-like Zn-dependent dehydrogenase